MRKLAVLIVCFLIVFAGCAKKGARNEVVVYTALDQNFSEPILKDFEKKTGIKVRPVYDVEATKTVGLVNRLIAEKTNPQADVFWNNEICRSIILANKGVLIPYYSPSAKDISNQFKDPEGYWTGFAARARVLIYNTKMVSSENVPESIFDMTKPEWKGKFALAYPLFGTTATHSAALFVSLGDSMAKEYFKALKENGAVIVDGNSTSKDKVAKGQLPVGFTDTDDANVAMEQGKPVDMVFPDKDGIGTLLIPNTVVLIAGGPNQENGKKLIDYLLSREVESKLSFSGSLQIPLRDGVVKPENVPDYEDIKVMKVDWEQVSDKMEEAGRFLQGLFVR